METQLGAEFMDTLPPSAFFRYSIPVAPKPERLRIDGSLGEWPDQTLLPNFGEMDGRSSFANVHLTWGAAGLYIALHVPNKTTVVSHRQNPGSAESVTIWIDTRDVRDVHRASRFCHQFIALPRGGGADRRNATAWQTPIRWARENAPICDPKKLKIASKLTKDSYSLELAVPAEALNGYDPTESPRLGFCYLVSDHEHGRQFWAPRWMRFWQDPSAWPTIELQGAAKLEGT